MNKLNLEKILEKPLSKQKVLDLACIANKTEFLVKNLIDLTFHKNEQLGFRAAWVLENVYLNCPASFLPQANDFFHQFMAQKNLSALRHYTKILALMTNKKAPHAIKEIIQQYEMAPLVETVFNWLITEKMPVAIKSHSLNILANLSLKQHWIRDELSQIMDFLVDKESIAFYAKVKQIRKQLAKSI